MLPDRIADSFQGKTVLITGSTGFLGKVLLEKLWRCAADKLSSVVLLIRPKNGENVQRRFEKLLQSPIFDKVRNVPLDFHLISCDLSEEKIITNEEDRELICREVNVVYHCAANCRFDEALRKSIFQNVRATKLLLELALHMKQLDIFFHVSSAYCHPNVKVLYEITYDPPADPEKIIKICEEFPENISVFTHKILKDIPNPYTFTKGLAEGMVCKFHGKFPIAILRPSFVIPIWKDPIPGWTDTYNGIIGFLIASGKGLLRSMHTDENLYTDFIPVDVLVSGALVAAFEFYREPFEWKICNLTTSSEYIFTWKTVKSIARKVADNRAPLNWVVWYPDTQYTTNYYFHQARVYLQHLIPAFLGDTLLKLTGNQPFLLKVHRKLVKGQAMMKYFGENQWHFHNEWSLKRRGTLNARERTIYTLFGDGLDPYEYFTNCTMSSRRFMLNEPDSTLQTARRHYKIMYYVHCGCLLLFYYYLASRLWTLLVTFIDL